MLKAGNQAPSCHQSRERIWGERGVQSNTEQYSVEYGVVRVELCQPACQPADLPAWVHARGRTGAFVPGRAFHLEVRPRERPLIN